MAMTTSLIEHNRLNREKGKTERKNEYLKAMEPMVILWKKREWACLLEARCKLVTVKVHQGKCVKDDI